MNKLLAAFFTATLALSAPLTALAGSASLILDARTGKVLSAENADTLNHPASLTKMMTIYMTFEAIKRGKLSWDSPVTVSKYAASRPPTKLGVRAGSTITVREAVLGMITKSANDAAAAMGEKIGGSEANFARLMTQRARQLGMSRTSFFNASGLPDSRQVTTARDMSTLAVALMRDFPNDYRMFSTASFNFRGRTIFGHNNLMYRYRGMDGIKTGYTNASGFNLVSAVRDGNRRVIGVVMGGRSARSRDDRMAALLTANMARASGSNRLLASVGGGAAVRDVEVASAAETDVPMPAAAPRSAETAAPRALGFAGAAVPIERPTALDEIANVGRPSASLKNLRQSAPQPQTLEAAAARIEATGSIPEGTAAAEEEPVAPGSGWQIQISAAPSADAARALLAQAKTAAGPALKSASPFTQAVGNGKAKIFRARFVGFESRDAADNACSALKRHSYDCLLLPGRG